MVLSPTTQLAPVSLAHPAASGGRWVVASVPQPCTVKWVPIGMLSSAAAETKGLSALPPASAAEVSRENPPCGSQARYRPAFFPLVIRP